MFCARRGATYKTMISANPRATFDPSDANSDSPICPAITEISATPIAAAVNSAEKKTNRKDFFLGKNGAILVAHGVKKRLRTLPRSTSDGLPPTVAYPEPGRAGDEVAPRIIYLLAAQCRTGIRIFPPATDRNGRNYIPTTIDTGPVL